MPLYFCYYVDNSGTQRERPDMKSCREIFCPLLSPSLSSLSLPLLLCPLAKEEGAIRTRARKERHTQQTRNKMLHIVSFGASSVAGSMALGQVNDAAVREHCRRLLGHIWISTVFPS